MYFFIRNHYLNMKKKDPKYCLDKDDKKKIIGRYDTSLVGNYSNHQL